LRKPKDSLQFVAVVCKSALPDCAGFAERQPVALLSSVLRGDRPEMVKLRSAILTVGLGLILSALTACSGGDNGRERPPPQVGYVTVAPSAVPLSVSLGGRTVAYETSEVRPQVNGLIRQRLGMTQKEFARQFQIPVGTLRDWEQERKEPDQTARTYLKVIARLPDVVSRALREEPVKA